MNKIITGIVLLIPMLIASSSLRADGSAIDKIYHPYVQPMEREMEWRMVAAEGDYFQRLGIGQSVSDDLFVEGYLIGQDKKDNFSLYGYEVEARLQLTEQGEYAIDWGLITELEKKHEEEQWEAATALLMEKQWGRWVGTANMWLKYEWGEHIKNEFETALGLQARYRYSPELEPAIELYSGENTRAIGPVAMGDVRFSPGKKLHWESGVLFGLDSKTPDATLRLLAEYEF